jgi:ligand-binding sensor domain-containing protein
MVDMKIKSIFMLAFLIAISGVSKVPAAIGTWHNYTYMNDARDIFIDSQYVWCATSGGLVKYDLNTGEYAKYLNSDGLGDINLLSLEVDSSGSVFIGGGNSTISRIMPGGGIRTYEFRYITDLKYNIEEMDADGDVLWVATGMGVGKFLIHRNDGEFQDVIARLGELPAETPIKAIKIIGDYIWAGSEFGLAFIDKNNSLPQNPQSWRTFAEGDSGLTDGYIYSITSIEDSVFAGTDNGVYLLRSDSTWSNIGPVGRRIYDLENLSSGLVAATDNGVYRRTDGSWTLLTSDSLINRDCRGVAEDLSGNIWGAFNKGGFAGYNGSYWEVVTIPGPASNWITDLAIDSSKNIWLVHTIPGFGSPEGVSEFDGLEWHSYNYRNSGIGPSGAVAVQYDHINDLVWFGSWGDGLISFDENDSIWINYDETNSPLRGIQEVPEYVVLTDVAVDDWGNVWGLQLGAINPEVMLAVFNPRDSLWWTYLRRIDQIALQFELVLYPSGNNIYIAGADIYRLNYGQNPVDTLDDSWYPAVGLNTVNALVLDNDGKLFVGAAFGLVYYDSSFNDTFIVELPDGYRSAVTSLALDGLGNKWVGTDSGVVVLSSRTQRGQPNWLTGFKTTNSDLIHNGVLHIEIDRTEGKVYIATGNGLSIYESGYAAPSADLSDIMVYPNPVYVNQGYEEIRFLRVPSDAEIFIYTASGELIKRFYYYEGGVWDLRNESNQKVAAGVYVFHVHAGEKSASGKFAVIR